MESISFHNTTDEEFLEVVKRTIKTRSQEEVVLILFRRHIKLTASLAWELFPNHETIPLTSIRRAISNLAFEKYLVKLEEKRKGIYGKPECYYKLNNIPKPPPPKPPTSNKQQTLF